MSRKATTTTAEKIKSPTVKLTYDDGDYKIRLVDKGDEPLKQMADDVLGVGKDPQAALDSFKSSFPKIASYSLLNAKNERLDPTNLTKIIEHAAEFDLESMTAENLRGFKADLKINRLIDPVLDIFYKRDGDLYVSLLSGDRHPDRDAAIKGLDEDLVVAIEVKADEEAAATLSTDTPATPDEIRMAEKAKKPTKTTKPKSSSSKTTSGKSTRSIDGKITASDLADQYHTQGTKIRRILRPLYAADPELQKLHNHQDRWGITPDSREHEIVIEALNKAFGVK